MAADWLADVKKYAADADDAVVAAIVRYCGIALQSRDSALVAMSDKKERVLVRESYLKKKLSLAHSDTDLDAAVLSVGQRMKADRSKNRVTVYYLLAEHFGLLSIFGEKSGATSSAVGLAGGAAGLAAMTPATAAISEAPAALPTGKATAPPQKTSHRGSGNGDNIIGWGVGIGLLVLGVVILAALLA